MRIILKAVKKELSYNDDIQLICDVPDKLDIVWRFNDYIIHNDNKVNY